MTIQQTAGGAIVATGSGITVYQALAVKAGLKACKIGMRVNRAYTPTNLMAMVQKITGKKHKLRDYDGAIASVEAWISRAREERHVAKHFRMGLGLELISLSEDGVATTTDAEGVIVWTPAVPESYQWRSWTNGDNLFAIVEKPED